MRYLVWSLSFVLRQETLLYQHHSPSTCTNGHQLTIIEACGNTGEGEKERGRGVVTWAGRVPHLGVLATLLTASCNRNGNELRLDGQLAKT